MEFFEKEYEGEDEEFCVLIQFIFSELREVEAAAHFINKSVINYLFLF